MGLFGRDNKKKTRTPARNTTARKTTTTSSNLGVAGMVRELRVLNSDVSIERGMYRNSEAIIVGIQKLSDLKLPKGYCLKKGNILTNSDSRQGMHEDIQLVTKFDYNFIRIH